MQELLKRLRLLSIDISAGAMVGALLIAQSSGYDLEISTLILLGNTVWLIYTVDHLIDGHRSKQQSGRHSYYFRNKRSLIYLSIAVAFLNIYLVSLQSSTLILFGAQLSFLVLLYILLSNVSSMFNTYFKELSCAILYAAGLSLPALAQGAFSLTMGALFLFYLLSAWINLLTISYFEVDYDRRSGFSSLPQSIGNRKTVRLIQAISVVLLATLLAAVTFALLSFSTILVLVTILILQGAITAVPQHFDQNERYRVLADLSYLLPILLVLG